jgi:hypothetical protein
LDFVVAIERRKVEGIGQGLPPVFLF